MTYSFFVVFLSLPSGDIGFLWGGATNSPEVRRLEHGPYLDR